MDLVWWSHLLVVADAGLVWQVAQNPDPALIAALGSLNTDLGYVVALLVRGWGLRGKRAKTAENSAINGV